MRNVDLVFILKQKLSDRYSTKFTFWRSDKEIFICGIFLFFIKYMGSIFFISLFRDQWDFRKSYVILMQLLWTPSDLFSFIHISKYA